MLDQLDRELGAELGLGEEERPDLAGPLAGNRLAIALGHRPDDLLPGKAGQMLLLLLIGR